MIFVPCFSQQTNTISESKTVEKLPLQIDTTHNGIVVPKFKRTNLGLYVTAREAYEMWIESPSQVKILDVRTLEEYIFVGHSEMAFFAELVIQTHNWDKEKKQFSTIPNPEFINLVKAWSNSDEIILVMCRSGGRSALAVNLLANQGFSKVYTILDGMEGDNVSDQESNYKGKRMKNGWINSGLPWTYNIKVDKILAKETPDNH